MSAVQIVSALSAGRGEDARALVFEYMAATMAEASGGPAPADAADLPRVLRDECANLAEVYRHPGTLLVAYADGLPAGCVGLASRDGHHGGRDGEHHGGRDGEHTAEVKRLFVRPAHRGAGIARTLMARAHAHAAGHGIATLLLDVMESRADVIGFYRRLGYTETEPFPTAAPTPMVFMRRDVGPAGIRLS